MRPNDSLRQARERTPSRTIPGGQLSRRELAEAVNAWLWETTGQRYELDAHTIARYERGAVRWPGAHYRAGLRHVLGMATDTDLGFQPSRALTRPSVRPPDYRLVSDPQTTAAEFAARISVETPVPSRVGWTDVEQVRATTRAFAASENLFGGGLSAEAAAGQLRWASRLVDVQASTAVRHAMLEAVGNLAGVVAFSAFDIGDQQAAADCFKFALWCAEEGESWPLRAATLSDMSRQAVYVGDVDEALSQIEFAQVRADRLSATGRAMIWTLRARLLAMLGRRAEARDEVRRADEFFAERDPEVDPPWLVYYDAAEHQGSTARALTPLALADRKPGEAADRSRAAIRLHSESYPRSRTFSKIRLATLLMTVGDPREAAAMGTEASADAGPLHSRRIARELRVLNRAAEQYIAIPEVAELRHGLAHD